MKFYQDEIIVQTNRPRDLEDMQMLVRELDHLADGPKGSARLHTRIYRIQHVDPGNLAGFLSHLHRGTVIVPHAETNSLAIQADPLEFERIMRVLARVDIEESAEERSQPEKRHAPEDKE